MPRQQRGANWRGQQLPVARRYIPDLAWSITAASGFTFTLQVLVVTGTLTVKHVPSFSLVSGQTATACVQLTPTTFSVTLSSAPPANFVANLPALDDGIRSDSGAYLAAASYNYRNPQGEPPLCDFCSDFTTLLKNRVWMGLVACASVDLEAGTPGDWIMLGCDPQSVTNVTVNAVSGDPVVTPQTFGQFLYGGGGWARV